MISAFCIVSAAAQAPVQPHLAQAWQAESTGDGEKGMTGLESYIYDSACVSQRNRKSGREVLEVV